MPKRLLWFGVVFGSALLAALSACQSSAATKNIILTATPPAAEPTSTATALHRVVATIPLDWKPTLIAQANGFLWVVGREDQSVARLDPNSNQFVGNPTHLSEPIYDIVADDAGIWVTGDTIVTRLDPSTGNIAATLRADQFGDGGPFRLAVGDGSIWLLNLIQATWGSHIHRIDAHSNRFMGDPATVGIEALGITFGAGSIWTANHDDATVSRVDPKTNEVMVTIKMLSEPHYIYFDQDGELVWVANYHKRSMSIIDPRTNQLIGEPLQVPFAPEWTTSGNGKVWVLPSPYLENEVIQNFEGLAEFNATGNHEVKIVPVHGRPMDAVLSDDSLWVTTQNPNQILRLSLE